MFILMQLHVHFTTATFKSTVAPHLHFLQFLTFTLILLIIFCAGKFLGVLKLK